MTDEKQLNKVPFFKKWWVNLVAGFVIGAIVFSYGIAEYENSKDEDIAESKVDIEKSVEVGSEETETNLETTEESTEATDNSNEEPIEPTLVYEHDLFDIYYVQSTEEGVIFLLENKSDIMLTVQANSVAINGISTNNIIMSDDVTSKSKGFVMATTLDLASAGTPETVSASLRVIDFTDSMETIDVQFTNVDVTE